MNKKNIRITIFKELRGILRDKKSLMLLFLMPLFIPFFIFFYGYFYNGIEEKEYGIGVNYELNSSELQIAEEIGGMHFEYYDTIEKLEKAYNDGEIDIYLVRNDNKYELYLDSSKQSKLSASQTVSMYLQAYNMQLASNYLTEQDIDAEEALNMIEIETKQLGDDDVGLLSLIISVVVPFIGMAIIMGTVTLATDAAAGEKERGTLETLLTFPIKSEEIITGKVLATSIVGICSGILSLTLTIISLCIAKSMFEIFEGATLNVSVLIVIMAIFVIIMLSLLASGICFAVAGNTKSYKEAQAALTPITLVAMVPLFLSMLEISAFVINFIPIVNCMMILNDIFFGTINYGGIIAMTLSTIVYIAVILKYISNQYKSEKTLFS